MIRKLILMVCVIALAVPAFAQVPPGPNAEFNNNPWSGNNPTRADGTSGYVLWNGTNAYDYHMQGEYQSGSGMNTVWWGTEWGSGVTLDTEHEIGANMCTMGIAVFSDFGIQVDLYQRFYELNAGPVHGAPIERTINFNGHVATNSPINIGLRAPTGGNLQFPSGTYNPVVTEIRAYKDGSLVGTWQPDETVVADALFTHTNCHADFQFQIDVTVPTHVNDGMTHLPFFFCPEGSI